MELLFDGGLDSGHSITSSAYLFFISRQLYYLHNRAQIDAYMLRLSKWREQRYQEWLANLSPLALRLRALKAQREQELLNHL